MGAQSLMKAFLLLIFVPSLVAGDSLCPNSKTTCPEGKECCEVEGEYSCCDPDGDQDTPAIRMKVVPGVEITSPTMFANSSFSTNESALPVGMWCYLLCPGNCCENDVCCRSNTVCCDNGCCPLGYSTCCESWCCKTGYRCGTNLHTFLMCLSTGANISPQIIVLLLLVASVFVSHRL
ncbi:hypothetical protein AVEN_142511-1 [Araneus ventricosus]|uniref:Granulins domain-containing protein n=1 Tax=Araneus ventricosus TaxID=182803 RepID=A0A4Y2CG76_ARAVE|nr:hypothetical protein AVEN_142511-1 [Araneus ventricosus]